MDSRKNRTPAVLRTWGQNPHYHPHIHFIVPAGALMPNNEWKHSRSRGKYLFKVELLSYVFRTRFIEGAQELIKNGTITGKIPQGPYTKDWVVYAKQPFGGPQKVIKYLTRYAHRTAISNERILKVGGATVTFSWKDYKQDYKKQTSTLSGGVFLGLFCQHTLPPGFTRIRHYGLISSASKVKSLPLIRKALKITPCPKVSIKPGLNSMLGRMGIIPGKCRCCGRKMVVVETLPNHFQNNQRALPQSSAGQDIFNQCPFV